MAAVAAVFYHALELGDMSVAENRFDELLRRFGLLDLVDAEGTGLVCGAADALVDHPPSPFIDVDETVRAREALNGFSCKVAIEARVLSDRWAQDARRLRRRRAHRALLRTHSRCRYSGSWRNWRRG